MFIQDETIVLVILVSVLLWAIYRSIRGARRRNAVGGDGGGSVDHGGDGGGDGGGGD